jgi:putative selenate reductase
MNLMAEYRRARPEVPISFSAGVDNQNFPDCVALGFTPITTCTDLLRPGGYARLPRYLENLEERMRGLGVRSLGDYVVKACGQGEAAIRGVVRDERLQGALVAALAAERVDLRGVLESAGRAALYDALVLEAARLNTPGVVAKVTDDPRYRAERNRAVPRKIGSQLALFDCINCDKCLPVCPNDANFVYETAPLRMEYRNFRVQAGQVVEIEGGVFEVGKAHQIANFQDFCNDCGNCDTFCPEDGGPYVEKPRFFGSLSAWQQLRRDGFFVRRQDGVDAIWGRLCGVEYRLEVDRSGDRGVFDDGEIRVELGHAERRPDAATCRSNAAEGHTLDFAAYLSMALVLDGVLDARRANPVNAASA